MSLTVLREKAMQLPLELGHDPAADRDHLLISRSIMPAINLIDRWPHWHTPVTVLVGPPGSGKTHLSTIWKGLMPTRLR